MCAYATTCKDHTCLHTCAAMRTPRTPHTPTHTHTRPCARAQRIPITHGYTARTQAHRTHARTRTAMHMHTRTCMHIRAAKLHTHTASRTLHPCMFGCTCAHMPTCACARAPQAHHAPRGPCARAQAHNAPRQLHHAQPRAPSATLARLTHCARTRMHRPLTSPMHRCMDVSMYQSVLHRAPRDFELTAATPKEVVARHGRARGADQASYIARQGGSSEARTATLGLATTPRASLVQKKIEN